MHNFFSNTLLIFFECS